MASLRDKNKETELREEMEWARVRALWVPLKNAFFKKEGGGVFEPTDLIKLSFDKKEEQSQSMSLKQAKALLGSKIKRNE